MQLNPIEVKALIVCSCLRVGPEIALTLAVFDLLFEKMKKYLKPESKNDLFIDCGKFSFQGQISSDFIFAIKLHQSYD